MSISKFIDLRPHCNLYVETTGTVNMYFKYVDWLLIAEHHFSSVIKVLYIKIV